MTSSLNHLDTIFFDLDSTLYTHSTGLWEAIGKRIDLYMYERMHFPQDQIPQIRHELYIQFGTTLRGLRLHHHVDPHDYLDFVHDLPLHEYITVDHELKEMLLSIPKRRWIFTNSDAQHAERVTIALGIEDCFEGLFDIWQMMPSCKPLPEVYNQAITRAGAADPHSCALIDDSHRNLAPAKELGYFTILVGPNGVHPQVDRTISVIHELPEVVPELWETA